MPRLRVFVLAEMLKSRSVICTCRGSTRVAARPEAETSSATAIAASAMAQGRANEGRVCAKCTEQLRSADDSSLFSCSGRRLHPFG